MVESRAESPASRAGRRRYARLMFWGGVVAALAGGYLFRGPLVHLLLTGERPRTVRGAVREYGDVTRRELEPACRAHGIAWPPRRVYLLAFKDERQMELWAANAAGPYAHIATYPILAASGGPGPKREDGDGQVPEGFYRIDSLNPQSQYHLSMRVSYPNDEDVRHARVPRKRMGGDIYVHGNRVSIGCLAMGDPAIERLFCVVAQASPRDRRILIAPVDFRRTPNPVLPREEPWVRNLYAREAATLNEFTTEAQRHREGQR